MKNKFLKLALLLTLICSLVLPLVACGNSSAVADANGGWEGISWDYKKDTKTLTITGSGKMPSAANESAVSWIAVRSAVEKVIFVEKDGKFVENIGDYAFYGMYNLKSVSLPKSITAIGNYAFAYCASLETITLPDGVASIGTSTFEMCSSLKEINLPATLMSLGQRAFALCTSLEKVNFSGSGFTTNDAGEETVMTLGDLTFFQCKKLSSVSVPSDFKGAFGKDAFKDAAMKADGVKKIDTSAQTPAEPEATEKPLETPTEAPTETPTEKPTEKPTESPTQAPTQAPDKAVDTGTIIALVVLGVVIVGIIVGSILLVRSNKKQANATVRKNPNNKK